MTSLLVDCSTGFNHFMCDLYVALQRHISAQEKCMVYVKSKSWGNIYNYYNSKSFIWGKGELPDGLVQCTGVGGATYWHSLIVDHMELNSEIKNYINNNLKIIGKKFIALCFRSGDRTNFVTNSVEHKSFIEECSKVIVKYCIQAKEDGMNVMLCADDVFLLKKWVDNKFIYNFGYNNLINKISNTKSIHILNENELKPIGITVYERNLYTIIDYYMMLLSTELIPAEKGNFSLSAFVCKQYLKRRNIDPYDLISL